MEEFKVMIFGGRDFKDYALMNALYAELIEKMPDKSISIISGMARGADGLAVKLAKEHGLTLYEFPADWNKHGKSAGFKRNVEMADACDAGIAFWDSVSRGTAHNINYMRKLKKPLRIVSY